MDKDLRKLLRQVEAQGFTWKRQSNSHIAVYLDGRKVTTFAATPSDRRSWMNTMSALKRTGFDPRLDRKGRRR